MEQCVNCGKPNLLVDKKGVCSECRSVIMLDVASRMDAIYLHSKLVETADDLETRLSNCDIIIENATALLPYEKIGVEVASPFPSEIVASITDFKDEIIMDEARKLVKQCRAAENPEGETLTKRLDELKALMNDTSRLEELEAE